LTTAAAGSIAREAAVRRVEPFHFSPRYSGQEARLLNEVMAAFTGRQLPEIRSGARLEIVAQLTDLTASAIGPKRSFLI